jgi:hypothetical protein
VSGERGRRGGVCGWRIGWLEQSETEWKKLRSPSVSEEAEVANAHEAAWQQVQEEAAQNSSTGSVMSRFLLPWAESRQRKVTWQLARATNRLLEIATR